MLKCRFFFIVFILITMMMKMSSMVIAGASICGCACGTTCNGDPDNPGSSCCSDWVDNYGRGVCVAWEPCSNGWITCSGPPCSSPTPVPDPSGGSNTPPVGCTPTAPAGPSLVAPADASTVTTPTITLSWTPNGLGQSCGSTATYLVCAGEDLAKVTAVNFSSNWGPSSCPVVSRSGLTTTSTSFTSPGSGTVYWKVGVFNGYYYANSVVYSMQIPTFASVTGRVYASNDLACTGTTPATGYTGGTMTMTNTDGLSGYVGSTQTGVNSSATFTVPGNTTTGYQYSLGFANDDTNWIMKCPLPSNHSLTVTNQPIEKSFYVTQIADPWRQVAV